MYRKIGQLFAYCAVVLFAYSAMAHEMTPTYPKLYPSHLDGVYKATVEVFNRRQDVEYYELGVFDKDFNPVPFVTTYRIVKVTYLSHVSIDVYVREEDVTTSVYICSQSKLRKDTSVRTAVASRICSKFK